MENHSVQPDMANILPFVGAGLSKQQIAHLADESVASILENGNAILMAEALAAMEEFVKGVRKDERFVQHMRDELSKFNGRLTTASGARIENCEAGFQFDYSANPEWCALETEIAILTERKKILEEKLRGLAPGKIIVDPETGEMLEGAQRYSRSTYRITLSK